MHIGRHAATRRRLCSVNPKAARAFTILIGLTTLGILVQSVLAAVFLQHDGQRDNYQSWINAHGMGAQTTTTLALIATIVAFVGLKARRSLGIASAVLLVALIAETVLGYVISGKIGSGNHDGLTVIHIPLGMLLISLATWLSVQSASLRRA